MTFRGFLPVFVILLFYSCLKEVDRKELSVEEDRPPDFVYLENDSFKIGSQHYFPTLMNYIIQAIVEWRIDIIHSTIA